jgi:nucleotide-binding universal stress UspA family protein
MVRSIVVASDGSEGAERAVSAAIDLAKTHGADLHMISVEELPQFPASVDEVIEEKTEANHVFEGVFHSCQGAGAIPRGTAQSAPCYRRRGEDDR